MSLLDEKLELGPVISIVAAIGAALTVVTGLVSSLGLSAFQGDVLAGTLFLCFSLYWIYLSFRVTKPRSGTGFVAPSSGGPSLLSLRLPYYLIVAVLSMVAIWFFVPAASALSRHASKVCGTVLAQCGAGWCAQVLDSRERPVSPECIPSRDSSGYFEFAAPTAMAYQPVYLRLKCDGKVQEIRTIPSSFFSPRCDGLLEAK